MIPNPETWTSVDAYYFRKMIRENMGNKKTLKLLLTGVWCKGRRMYWRRDSL